MKLYYKNKILINGLYPMVDYKIDGYLQKTGIYDESALNLEHEDIAFYCGGHLLQAMYSVKNKKGTYYEYFENDELFEIEVSSSIDNISELQDELLKKIRIQVNLLEKKLRLITNFSISLPIFKAIIYNEKNEFVTFVGTVYSQASNLFISEYTDTQKSLLAQRLNFYITNETLLDLENKNIRFKRALDFYINSFIPCDKGIRFTLLFSSLESLFNIDGESIAETVSTYGSKMLFLNTNKQVSMQRKLKDYYDIRSKYIHGNDPRPITEKNEFDLRELVREILLIYWNISISENIYDASDMMSFLDKYTQDDLNLTIQLFIKGLHVVDYDSFYNSVVNKLKNNDTKILSDETV